MIFMPYVQVPPVHSWQEFVAELVGAAIGIGLLYLFVMWLERRDRV